MDNRAHIINNNFPEEMKNLINNDLVSVKEEDFLEQDPSLRSQNYVCISFISPEEVIKKKESYFFEKYLENFSRELNISFDNLTLKYPEEKDTINSIKDRYSHLFDTTKINEDYNDFAQNHSEDLNEEYYKQNNFQTCVRGVKIRGVFDTLKEANIRAQVLKRLDDKFHIYIGEVGAWLPWAPNPNDISEQEFAEDTLNTLMKKYKENQDKKNKFFEERKKELQSQNKHKEG
jgi:hypothetical protein